MELEASRALPADRDTVWRALNDPETLRRCIPGCESLERGEDGTLNAKVTAKVGPVSAKFAGNVALHDLVPPESYRLAFQGQGGAAGFAKGEAWVRLEEADGGGTTMHYRSKASVGGKLAQVGARLIDASARKLSDEFFDRFAAEVARADAAVGDADGTATAAGAPSDRVDAGVAPDRTEAGAGLSAAAAAASAASGIDAAAIAGVPPVLDTSRPSTPPGGGSRVVWIAIGAIVVAALAWYLLR